MAIYKAGLSVYTTLDAQAQKWAVDAVRKGARMYERRHGWRVKFDNVLEEGGGSIEDYRDPSWIAVPEAGDIMTGMIREVSERGAQVSFGSYSAFITAEHTEALDKPPSKIFKRGDLAQPVHFGLRQTTVCIAKLSCFSNARIGEKRICPRKYG